MGPKGGFLPPSGREPIITFLRHRQRPWQEVCPTEDLNTPPTLEPESSRSPPLAAPLASVALVKMRASAHRDLDQARCLQFPEGTRAGFLTPLAAVLSRGGIFSPRGCEFQPPARGGPPGRTRGGQKLDVRHSHHVLSTRASVPTDLSVGCSRPSYSVWLQWRSVRNNLRRHHVH